MVVWYLIIIELRQTQQFLEEFGHVCLLSSLFWHKNKDDYHDDINDIIKNHLQIWWPTMIKIHIRKWFACDPQPPFADSTPSHIWNSTSTFPSLSPILNKNNKYSFIPGYTFSAGVHINIKVERSRQRFTHINMTFSRGE